jgi:uncharacterized protein
MTPTQMFLAAAIGLSAGVLGGLAGIGGSMIILPGLALVFGFHTPEYAEQHLYMAAAMATNTLVALPATSRHMRARAVRRELVIPILPAMLAAMILGVLASNYIHGQVLKRLLAGFIAAYALVNLYRMYRPLGEVRRPPERTSRPMLIGIGGLAGLFGGLLGLGGGVVMVPLLQVVSRVRLREAIAVSSAVMIATALVGAMLKFATLPGHGMAPAHAALLVLTMAPTAMLGATLGAHMTHRLPLYTIRGIVSVLLLVAAARMSGLFM